MNRFELQQYENGQIYLTERGKQRLHARIKAPNHLEIQIGASDTVEIDKLYGPMVFFPLRVTIDLNECDWVVERLYGDKDEWREVARVPGQLESDFSVG